MQIKTKKLFRQIAIYLNVKIPNIFYAKSEIELKFQDHICIFLPSYDSSKSPSSPAPRGAGAGACGGGGGGG